MLTNPGLRMSARIFVHTSRLRPGVVMLRRNERLEMGVHISGHSVSFRTVGCGDQTIRDRLQSFTTVPTGLSLASSQCLNLAFFRIHCGASRF